MEKYTIYCTPEQTKKALILGASLFRLYSMNLSDYIDMIRISDNEAYTIPTAEQMIGWLEDQSCIDRIKIDRYTNGWGWYYVIYTVNDGEIEICHFSSRKEATLAAIDTALDYLSNSKK